MSNPDDALATQMSNIQARTGKTLKQLTKIIADSGLTRHSDIRAMLMQTLSLGHGDANTLAHAVQRAGETAPASPASAIEAMYAGPKAGLRPIHDALMTAINTFGPFEIAPKKGYVSLRRTKQFAMIGPATKTRVDLGINARGLPSHDQLLVMPPNSMCQYQVRLTVAGEVNARVIAWIRAAYDSAG